MAVISLKDFTGAIPKLPAHLLPENAAALAFDCKFAHGELRPLNGPNQIAGPMSNIVRGLYTEDGTNFYTWDHDVFAVRTPLIDDQYGRFYYSEEPNGTLPAFFRVYTKTAPVGFGPGMNPHGGPPPQSLYVGVPKANDISLISALDSATLPDLGPGGLKLVLNFWYEKDGKRYQPVNDIPFTGVAPDGSFGPSIRKWMIILPTMMLDVDAHSTPATVFATEYAFEQLSSEGQVIEQWVSLNENIQVVSTSEIYLLNPDGSFRQAINNVSQYKDANGVEHTLAEPIGNIQTQLATPADATPVVEAKLTDLDSGQQLFHLYSSNSTLANNGSGKIEGAVLSVAKVFADLNLFVQLDYPVMETRTYVITNVNSWGEESEPSEPYTITLRYDQHAVIDYWFQNQGAFKEQVAARVYRTLTSNSGSTSYQFVKEESLMVGTSVATFATHFQFTDDVPGSRLQETLPSAGWTAPPLDLRCVTAMPNGVLAGFRSNQLYFCEPFKPFAWPVDYILTFPYDIVGLCSHGNGLLVTTTGYPYMVNGVHPDSMTAQKLPVMQAGVSARGMADTGASVAYISHDGICVVTGGQGSMAASQQLFTREDWRAKYDSNGRSLKSLRLSVYDGALVAIDPNAPGFLIRLDEDQGTFSDCSVVANAAFFLPQTDQFYLGIGNAVYGFDEGAPLLMTWVSKDFVVQRPTNFGALEIIAQLAPGGSGSLEYAVYADGIERTRTTVPVSATQTRTVVRLPSGFTARRWAVGVRGQVIVKELHLANVPSELQNG